MSSENLDKTIQIDARGPRFSAALTTLVLALALVTGSVWIAAFQAAVFAIGAIKGPQFTPYAFIFRTLIKPRLKSPLRTEDVRPPKFAQSIGLAFALVGTCGSFCPECICWVSLRSPRADQNHSEKMWWLACRCHIF